ncbi:hypothetical protein PR048_006368, partial [Dryococelus australis]
MTSRAAQTRVRGKKSVGITCATLGNTPRIPYEWRGEFWAAVNIEVLMADEGDTRFLRRTRFAYVETASSLTTTPPRSQHYHSCPRRITADIRETVADYQLKRTISDSCQEATGQSERKINEYFKIDQTGNESYDVQASVALGCASPLRSEHAFADATSSRDLRGHGVPDDAAGQRIFSVISRLPRPCIPALLHSHFVSPASALKTSMLKSRSNLNSRHALACCMGATIPSEVELPPTKVTGLRSGIAYRPLNGDTERGPLRLSSDGMKGRRKWDFPVKIRRPPRFQNTKIRSTNPRRERSPDLCVQPRLQRCTSTRERTKANHSHMFATIRFRFNQSCSSRCKRGANIEHERTRTSFGDSMIDRRGTDRRRMRTERERTRTKGVCLRPHYCLHPPRGGSIRP